MSKPHQKSRTAPRARVESKSYTTLKPSDRRDPLEALRTSMETELEKLGQPRDLWHEITLDPDTVDLSKGRLSDAVIIPPSG